MVYDQGSIVMAFRIRHDSKVDGESGADTHIYLGA